jgi:integrase
MTSPLSSLATPAGGPTHCPIREYRAYLTASYPRRGTWRQHITRFEAFIDRFPDLDEWFGQPLVLRIGWQNHSTVRERYGYGPPGIAAGYPPRDGWVSYRARRYLIYLAFTGRIRLDWPWLLGVQVLKPWQVADYLGHPLREALEEPIELVKSLAYQPQVRQRLTWAISRLVLRRGDPDMCNITDTDIDELRATIGLVDRAPEFSELSDYLASRRINRRIWPSYVFQTAVVFYHAGITTRLPQRGQRAWSAARQLNSRHPRIDAVMERFVDERGLSDRASTLEQARYALRRLSSWLDENRPDVECLDQLTRSDMIEFAGCVSALRTKRDPGKTVSDAYIRNVIWNVITFFRHITQADYPDAPARPLLTLSDLPRPAIRVPRFIPDEQLEPVMAKVRQLDCPLQRAALLTARWSGARRGEIRKLELDCLDAYPDGTARLRLPAGKSRRERSVPLHDEAADALRELIKTRRDQHDRGLADPDTGRMVRYLFLRKGCLASPTYLFDRPLKTVCDALGLVDAQGSKVISAHRFRHTLGTQLAERGARTQTIMKVLGHRSAGMSMTYSAISDPTVLADYQAVLKPGAIIAGPHAEAIRAGRVDEDTIDWLRTNFYKTELELGRCLRLPDEGPCECDLYLSCAKFVTTPDYAPRLRERLTTEEQLIADARERGWPREVERHQRIADRIRYLLTELGEPEPPTR